MKKEVLILILFLIALSKEVNSIAISPAKFELNFEPDLTLDLEVKIISTVNYPINATLSFRGDLAKYIIYNLTQIELNASGYSVQKFKLKLPHKINTPGENSIAITTSEIVPSLSGIMVGTAVESQIKIFVPFPNKYVKFDFIAENANKNEPVNFFIKVKNLGEEKVNNLTAYIEIFSNFKLIKKLTSDTIPLEKNEEKEIKLKLLTKGLSAGNYLASTGIIYDNIKSDKIDKEFKIGTLDINLTNYTNKLLFNQINKLFFRIESRWNNNINKIYATILLKQDENSVKEIIKTNEILLSPFSLNDLIAYLDTNGLQSGNYLIELKVYFNDQTKKYELPVIIEQPILQPASLKQPVNKILIFAIIFIVIFDILWIAIRNINKRKKEKKLISSYKEDINL